MRRLARAKVNLALSVGAVVDTGAGRGMHRIASWMHSIDLADIVEVRPLAEGETSRYVIAWDEGAIRTRSGEMWPVDEDLAVRAHRLLEREMGRALPVALEVRKRIPVGAGLGGGSSDAAAALLAVNEALGLGLSVALLAELSTELGSDVAFFVDEGAGARAAIVSGFGEVVERVEQRAGALVLVVPPFGCATRAVYESYDELGGRELREEEVRGLAAGGLSVSAPLFNDLAAAAERVEPRLAEIRRTCAAVLNRPVHITGSGSAMFALARSLEEAEEVARAIALQAGGVEARGVRLV